MALCDQVRLNADKLYVILIILTDLINQTNQVWLDLVILDFIK